MLFDINADGVKDRITWSDRGSTVAFVAMDLDGDGQINDGSELFGNAMQLASGENAVNGFEALNALDLNHDGRVDGGDPDWPRLLLWIDADHDGISQADELLSVTRSTLTGIETDYRWTGRRDAAGNVFGYQSNAYLGHGRRPIWDVFLRSVP
ncbi:MAG TPA: hypothetical protein VHW00_03425 [Thermoanaerobaculia bacterium]|nr:hypothetical protein [Thermoanaerobaculia bacterium]